MQPYSILLLFLCLVVAGYGQVPEVSSKDSLLDTHQQLRASGEIDQALALMQSALEQSKATQGELHPDQLVYLDLLASDYFDAGNFPEAQTTLAEAKAGREALGLTQEVDYADNLDQLGQVFLEMGNYREAEEHFSAALEIREEIQGKTDPAYAGTLANLGELYWSVNQYEKAERYLMEALQVRAETIGKAHPDYATTLNALGMLNQFMGNTAEAERYLLECKELTAQLLGTEHPNYANALYNLANLYWSMGNYRQAEPLMLQSREILANTLGTEHPHYAYSLSGLGVLYKDMNAYDKAEACYLESKALRAQTVGTEHPEYAHDLRNLGTLYREIGQYDKAESHLLEALAIQEKTLGKQHRRYASTLYQLSAVYLDTRQFDTALTHLESVRAIEAEVLGDKHPNYGNTLLMMAKAYDGLGQKTEALPLFLEADAVMKTSLSLAARHSSEQELRNYIQRYYRQLDRFYAFAYTYPEPDATLLGACYDQALFYKGFLLNNVIDVRGKSIADPRLLETFEQWQAVQRQLGESYLKPLDRQTAVPALEEEANLLEKELTRAVAGFGQSIRQSSWQEVQQQLGAQAAAIEFIHFHTPDDSVIYAALLLKPAEPAPKLIRLFEASELTDLIYQEDLAAAQRLETMYASRGGRPKHQALPPKGLYEIIWQNLEPELEGVKQIYYAASGILHRINIAGLAGHKKDLLSEQYEMTRLNSTRRLTLNDEVGEERRGALLFGGITYDPNGAMAPKEGATEGAWKYLDWTQREVAAVREILVEAGVPAFIKAKDEASEAVFKTLGKENPVPRILHLATHGFFFPDPQLQDTDPGAAQQQPQFAQSPNPMLRSGLILAGANEVWTGGTAPEGQEDGILTAYEISQMNLKGTELVVLSACETGLGDIEDNEGVYGLQRAFKAAGVRYLMLSLWQVPDKETMEFMNTFYSHWLEDEKTIPEAFRLTQKKMSNQYENPFWWAGFILVE